MISNAFFIWLLVCLSALEFLFSFILKFQYFGKHSFWSLILFLGSFSCLSRFPWIEFLHDSVKAWLLGSCCFLSAVVFLWFFLVFNVLFLSGGAFEEGSSFPFPSIKLEMRCFFNPLGGITFSFFSVFLPTWAALDYYLKVYNQWI